MQRVSVPKLAMAEVTKSGENRRKVATVPALVSMYQRTLKVSIEQELDPVGSTVRYEVMKLIIDVTGSVEGTYAFIHILYRSGQLTLMPHRLTY